MMLIAMEKMKNVISTQTYAKNNVKKRKIAKVTNRLVMQAWDFVSMVRFIFNKTQTGGSCFVFKNALQILTAAKVKLVTDYLKHAENHVRRREIVMVLN